MKTPPSRIFGDLRKYGALARTFQASLPMMPTTLWTPNLRGTRQTCSDDPELRYASLLRVSKRSGHPSRAIVLKGACVRLPGSVASDFASMGTTCVK